MGYRFIIFSKIGAEVQATLMRQDDDKCKCELCKIIRRDAIQDTRSKRSFTVISDANCKDQNLVYVLLCKKCEKTVYVGETERPLKERIDEHMRDIKYQKEKPIMINFINNGVGDLEVAVVARTTGQSKNYRLIVDNKWIQQLETRVPTGCNVNMNI